MRLRLSLLLALCTPALAAAQSPAVGDWSGVVEGLGLATVFHITEADGVLTTTLDVPAQGALAMPTGETTLDGQTLTVTVPSVAAVFTGTLDGDVLTGVLEQGQAFPLVMRRLDDGETPSIGRADEPQPPFPYREEDVSVPSVEGVTLAGTLTIPDGAGPFPGVVLVSGSGAQNRDSEVLGHRLFRVLADHLARRGIAVLRYDDRGTAASTGDYDAATTADLALDTQAVAEALAARPETASVGIVGHSEGGAIAPIVASASDAIDYVVLLAGPAISGRDVLAYQLARDPEASGATAEGVAAYRRAVGALLDAVASGDAETAAERGAAAYRGELASLSQADRTALGVDALPPEALAAGLAQPWERFFIGYDPAPALRALRVPALALFAARDQQVRASDNVPAAVEALAGAPAGSAVVVLPDLNHLFQPSQTGAPSEYATINTSYAPAVMEQIADWVLDR